jgi:hypothetical protein
MGIAFLFVSKAYLHLAHGMTSHAFHSLHRQLDIHRFSSYRHSSKTSDLLPPTLHLAAAANPTSQSPMVLFYGYNDGARFVQYTLVKVSDYAKRVVQ